MRNWIHRPLAAVSFCAGAALYFSAQATYEGFEMMTALTAAILCWPALRTLFTLRMILFALLIIAPVSLLFQVLAVQSGIWVYGNGRYVLGRVHISQLGMPWMEAVFYFLFPIFQFGAFAFFLRRFPPRPISAQWSKVFPVLFFLVPTSFAAQGLYLSLHPWQYGHRPVDWNCAIMATAFAVTLLAYGLSRPYRRFVRSLFFAAWTLGMGVYMLLWERFHVVWHDHWRYVLNRSLFPPWILVDSEKGLGLSQAQLYGYFMTAVVFPAIAFLAVKIRSGAEQPEAPASPNPLK